VSQQTIDICGNRGKFGERLFHVGCWLAILLPLTMLVVLVADVAIDGLGRLDWDFIKGFPSRRAHRAGIWPALWGTLWLVGLTALLAIPIGVGAAVYLEEYGGNRRLANFIELNIANLAGVPSVIYGLLGLEVFVRIAGFGSSVLAGACTLALLVLPIVIISAREALRTVPYGLREAALGLGCTPWQMIRRVVLPMALPGILTGAILSVSRAIGETAPLILVGAVVFITFTPEGLDSQFTALPIQIFNWVSMPQKGFMENAAAGIVVLLITLLSINLVAILLRNRFQRQKY
jgi:phosphate transport system permease protein